jgi:hypothetical protein
MLIANALRKDFLKFSLFVMFNIFFQMIRAVNSPRAASPAAPLPQSCTETFGRAAFAPAAARTRKTPRVSAQAAAVEYTKVVSPEEEE